MSYRQLVIKIKSIRLKTAEFFMDIIFAAAMAFYSL
jgi:hypothetical protein